MIDATEPRTRWMEISVGDTSMPVYSCTPSTGKPKAAVIVLQEIFGVNEHIRTVSERLAVEGYLTLAPDLFHRQGQRFEASYEDTRIALARSQAMSSEQALTDIDRVIATLDPALRVGVVGFCMGGRIAFQTSFNPRVSAAASFYGTRIADKALQWVSQVQCPLLLLFGEEDTHISTKDVATIREALHEHSKEAEIVIYPGAGHGFFCDARESFSGPAAKDSWDRLRHFFDQKLVVRI